MYQLTPHPDHPSDAVEAITVGIAADGEHVGLTYRVTGDLGRLLLPGLGRLRREDRLWTSTCFEIFLRYGPVGYREYNFAPDGRWSAYRFASYRRARSNLSQKCHIEALYDDDAYVLSAHILGQGVAGHDIGLSTIIKERDGRTSFWALAHPDGDADFHHDACFALKGDDL
ncbi:DOMON domain-containing protein [Sphingomicrobium arenosum]|uniref:hypothetical protein n=1 Tax=Sphingomicrobium arenosum TaxID=2233861 RepID=UPI0022406402|nr:hypothetical protein [Sphingomicrobium arenosum]